MSTKITVMLVDDHAALRSGLQRLLEQISGFDVIAEADSGEKAYELLLGCAYALDDEVIDDDIPVKEGKVDAKEPTTLQRVEATKLGELKNPYAGKYQDVDIVEIGRKKYLRASCNGCHGGSGGGGMCPPLSNEVWVYGSDDDTLFRLITLGSIELQKRYGLTRKGRENVVGPMPQHAEIVKSEDDLWKIITFIRANYRGDSTRINW